MDVIYAASTLSLIIQPTRRCDATGAGLRACVLAWRASFADRPAKAKAASINGAALLQPAVSFKDRNAQQLLKLLS